MIKLSFSRTGKRTTVDCEVEGPFPLAVLLAGLVVLSGHGPELLAPLLHLLFNALQ
jgi:hypothetical protein